MDEYTWSIIDQQRGWLGQHAAADGLDLIQLGTLKLTEEIGEVATALIGATGTNPRKGITHGMDDVADELADVAITALIALAAVTDDAREALAARLTHVYTRSLDHGAPPLPPPEFEPDRAAWIAAMPRVLTATIVVISDPQGRVLLVQQPYRPGERNWALPGGGVNENEPPRIGARREVAEELGLDITPGRLLGVDWMPATDRPPILICSYEGGILAPEQAEKIRPCPAEVSEFGFYTLGQAEDLLPDHAHRRLAAALAVRDGHAECVDLNQGRLP
ncbi:MAG: NUDIX domain-containing protein [Catenulispora sp.]|nr:NUDIX domain-containing protein [Catenulispora sp.]NUR57237.1 NUDIX domain-containing protein [Catenulispora sp.]